MAKTVSEKCANVLGKFRGTAKIKTSCRIYSRFSLIFVSPSETVGFSSPAAFGVAVNYL